MVNVVSPDNQAKLKLAEERIKTLDRQLAEHKRNAGPSFEKWATAAAKNLGEKPVEPSGLMAHLPLDVFKGRKTADVVNENATANWEGDGRTIGGKFGGAFRVEGNGFINVKGIQPPEWNQPFSFGCWVKPDAGNASGALFSKMNEASSAGSNRGRTHRRALIQFLCAGAGI